MGKVSNKILCYYSNFSNQIQIIRITNIPNFYFEKVVFPGDRILFEAVPNAQLEVYTSTTGCEILLEKISCDRLHVNEGIGEVDLDSLKPSNLAYL